VGRQAPRAGRLYGMSLAVAGLGLLVVGASLACAYRALHLGASAGGVATLGGRTFSYPTLNPAGAVVLVLAVLGLSALVVAVWSARRQIRVQRRLEQALAATAPSAEERAGADVWLVADDVPRAFCAGLLRPRIYVSRGALRILGRDELRAVVAHEACHRARRDPLRLALVDVLGDAAFFLPAVRRLGVRYRAMAELAADEAAVTACGGDPGPLARALLALGGTAHGEPAGTAGISVAPERVDRLIGRPLRWPPLAPAVLVSLVLAALLGGAALEAGRGASIQTSLRLPLLSSQPCVLVLALVPLAIAAAAVLLRRRLPR
jgi:Zn-dependent protease with chaperone function